jgi:hypothetical protein
MLTEQSHGIDVAVIRLMGPSEVRKTLMSRHRPVLDGHPELTYQCGLPSVRRSRPGLCCYLTTYDQQAGSDAGRTVYNQVRGGNMRKGSGPSVAQVLGCREFDEGCSDRPAVARQSLIPDQASAEEACFIFKSSSGLPTTMADGAPRGICQICSC